MNRIENKAEIEVKIKTNKVKVLALAQVVCWWPSFMHYDIHRTIKNSNVLIASQETKAGTENITYVQCS